MRTRNTLPCTGKALLLVEWGMTEMLRGCVNNLTFFYTHSSGKPVKTRASSVDCTSPTPLHLLPPRPALNPPPTHPPLAPPSSEILLMNRSLCKMSTMRKSVVTIRQRTQNEGVAIIHQRILNQTVPQRLHHVVTTPQTIHLVLTTPQRLHHVLTTPQRLTIRQNVECQTAR